MITNAIKVAGLLIALGDGDTNPGLVYIQRAAGPPEWVAFPRKSIPDVIAALRSIDRESEKDS